MRHTHRNTTSIEHRTASIIAVVSIALHFVWFGYSYLELLSAVVRFRFDEFGDGKLLLGNMLYGGGLFGGLLCLVVTAFRSIAAPADRPLLPSIMLLFAGFLLPILGIYIGWFVAGDA